jgi:hypothetical protein
VTRHLAGLDGGYLFLYTSPRVVINRDVTAKLARHEGRPTGILTVTSNAQIISAAPRYHRDLVERGLDSERYIEAAVVVDGVPDLRTPTGPILMVSPEQEHEIESRHAGSRLGKTALSEYEDLVEERPMLGVLATMARSTRALLEGNPGIRRAVLTAALQSLREKSGGRNTMDALSRLFRDKPTRRAGVEERRRFAQRMPVIVAMVDELTGDGAGAPFVHALADWLREEFIAPFDDNAPFTVVLVIADASLGNEVVLDRYLNAGPRMPDKVLVSRSRGRQPFALAATKLQIGGGKPRVLHVMTNSYPASALSVRYQVNLSSVSLQEKQPGSLETPRQAIQRVAGAALLDNAVREILRAMASGAEQVIYFAQDKRFLRTLRGALTEPEDSGLDEAEVRILDSSVPASERKALVEETRRDRIKVFLMTSSGARGVSFPKADWIIAAVPRFNIEAALMEIAQLIYRGRGDYRGADGERRSGDEASRRLVMLIDDFWVQGDTADRRQWLRLSLDLMTLLVMLRATILTRITGDAGLGQNLALVPVGGVGLDELLSPLFRHVTDFLAEADTYVQGNAEGAGLVSAARRDCAEIFSRFRLEATARRDAECLSFARDEVARRYFEAASTAIAPLLPGREGRPRIPDRAYFAGPILLERWDDYDMRELFHFEGHSTAVEHRAARFYGQLRHIDADERLPHSLRIPALNLYRLLARDKSGAARGFSILKLLRSPHTWVALPAAYCQFFRPVAGREGQPRPIEEPEFWRMGLGRALSASGSVMPAIARYEGKPWVAGVGPIQPLNLNLVFDDRYFMASNELNLLNALLLAGEGEE